MLDSSTLPDVSDLGLEHRVEIAYASHMAAREIALHAIFGPTEPPGRILSPGDPNLFINWSGGGVYQYPPSQSRTSWHYVTSGLSQPQIADDGSAVSVEDEDGGGYSGFGIELVISTHEEAAWAPHVLINLVKYLLFQKNSRIILPGDRIPCNGPLVLDTNTKLNHLVATTSDQYESQVLLPAGNCDLVHLIGATQGEIDQALTLGTGTAGSIVLCHVMERMGVGCDSMPERDCLTLRPEFRDTWHEEQASCESRWARSRPNEA